MISQLHICLVLSHYINQIWVIGNLTRRNKPRWHLNQNTIIAVQENVFSNVIYKMTTVQISVCFWSILEFEAFIYILYRYHFLYRGWFATTISRVELFWKRGENTFRHVYWCWWLTVWGRDINGDKGVFLGHTGFCGAKRFNISW